MTLRIQRIEAINKRLAERYPQAVVGGSVCFVKGARFFRLDEIGAFDAILVEYAVGIEAAENNVFEDGDLFYMDELSEEEMFTAILSEIEAD